MGNETWVDGGSAAAFTLCGHVQGAFGPSNPRQPVYCAGGAGVWAQYVVLYRPEMAGQLTLCEVDLVVDEVSLSDSSGTFSATDPAARRLLRAGRLQRWQP